MSSFGIPVRNGLGVGLLASTSLATRNRVGFSPLSLFAAGEQGYWLDPSDFSTMFQDAAGTTPVTATGQSVRLMLDKSQGLVLGPELVTNGDFSSSAGWALSFGTTVSGGAANFDGVTSATVNQPLIERPDLSAITGKWYEVVYTITASTTNLISFLFGSVLGEVRGAAGTYRQIIRASTSGTLQIVARAVTGIRTGGIDNISVREIPGNHFTQSNVSNAPLLQQDGTGRYFLLFDGSDDWLQSAATINPGAVDKVQVFAGVRKLSDAAAGIVLETSADINANAGSFNIAAPGANAAANYGTGLRGTGLTGFNLSTFAAPITNVLQISYDLAGVDRASEIFPRVNGATPTLTGVGAALAGTGNYLTYTHFIGRRGGTTLPFNGRLYQLITRYGANLTADQIAATETFVNQRTGAY